MSNSRSPGGGNSGVTRALLSPHAPSSSASASTGTYTIVSHTPTNTQNQAFQRLLKPTWANLFIWIPALGLVYLLCAILNTHQQLVAHQRLQGDFFFLPPSFSTDSIISSPSPPVRPTSSDLIEEIEHGERPPIIKNSRDKALEQLRNEIKRQRELQSGQTGSLESKPTDTSKNTPLTLPPPSPASSADIMMPLLVFTFNRPENLRKTLDSLLSHRPPTGHPIFISQDGTDAATRQVAMEYVENKAFKDIHYLNHHFEDSGVQVEPQHQQWTTYYKIATHYGWALRQLFDGGLKPHELTTGTSNGFHFNHVILIEDDMEIAPDFYSYFRRTSQLLDADPTLLCVSAWNDNGRRPLVGHPSQLYRSECFPGLGWLMNRRIWDEMRVKWPKGFWDDWLREPPQRQERSCIFPEMNRVYTFGEKGSSAGQFYDQYLRSITLNTELVDWPSMDLTYLSSLDQYRRFLWSKISTAKVVQQNAYDQPGQNGEFRVEYQQGQLDAILQQLNMMTDHKAGIPRTSFEGVLQFTKYESGNRFWIVPLGSKFTKAEYTPN